MHVIALVVIALAQPAPAAALPSVVPIVGTIVDPDGRPVDGAEVLLSSGLPPSGERPRIGGVFAHDRQGKPVKGVVVFQ